MLLDAFLKPVVCHKNRCPIMGSMCCHVCYHRFEFRCSIAICEEDECHTKGA
jgi:hypothetical protein